LVCRLPSPEDRRVKVLKLTPAGARLRANVLRRFAEPPSSLNQLSAEEQRALVKMLRHLLGESQ
jgi:DNA-binding MarR family transcriptional regulator